MLYYLLNFDGLAGKHQKLQNFLLYSSFEDVSLNIFSYTCTVSKAILYGEKLSR